MNSPAAYMTVASKAEGFYKEKGSKFLSFIFPVENEEEVEDELGELRKQYHDARHHCYAYILGPDRDRVRANDDGEPAHSAGDPILGQLKSRELTNVLCVVVRYFGGTKLGVGGLIAAYRTAAAEALASATIVEKEVVQHIRIAYPYASTNEVMRLTDEFNLNILDQEFTEDCRMDAFININFVAQMKEKVELLNSTGTPLTLDLR